MSEGRTDYSMKRNGEKERAETVVSSFGGKK